MRNFIVAFMVLILLSSIMFVMLRPVNNHTEKKQLKEKSHVEKLLTEQVPNEPEKNTENTEPEKIITEVFDENIYIPSKTKDYTKPQPFAEKNTELNQINETEKNNTNYQSITNELMEKYDNNPDAIVTEEDLQKLMIKILQTATQQQ